MFNLNEFIGKYVTKRDHSMFEKDILDHAEEIASALEGKRVLVIGGAGSIGSSFIRETLKYHPSELYIVDTNENALTELTRDLRSGGSFVPDIYKSYPMDYSSVTFRRFFTHHKGFDIVANFSAHKHVRSEKDIYSVEALLRNNVIHARGLLELLQAFPPETYFCVSTDKAANPVNIMGASKRIMEDLIFSYSDQFHVKTARFANVAFSNGSLPFGFLERLSKLQPISAPSDVKRYFVSPAESGQICMLAASLGENREIFFPKLEEAQMMTFDEIALKLLKEYGFEAELCDSDEEAVQKAAAFRKAMESQEAIEPENGTELRGIAAPQGTKAGMDKYPVRFLPSDTSGEKAYEEFYTDEEEVDLDRFDSLGVIKADQRDRSSIEELIQSLEDAFENECGKAEIVEILAKYLPWFEHIETGRSLDEKM